MWKCTLLRLVLGTLIGAAALVPEAALTQDVDENSPRLLARKYYQEGKALYDEGKYVEALKSFEAAYDTQPHPVVLKSVAECKFQLGDIIGAITIFEQFMADPESKGKDSVRDRLEELEAMLGILEVTTVPDGAKVAIDGNATGETTPAKFKLPRGKHELKLELKGFDPVVTETTIEPGAQSTTISIDLASDTTSTKADPEEGVVDPFSKNEEEQLIVDDDDRGPSPGFWVCAAVAGVGVVSGTVFGTLALNDENEYNKKPTKEKMDAGKRNALIADISFGVAAAAAVAGVIILIVDYSHSGNEAEEDPDSSEARIDIFPTAGSDSIGLNTVVHF